MPRQSFVSVSALTALAGALALGGPAWAADSPKAPDLSGLTVKVDKKPLKLKGAALYGLGSSARYLELSTEPLPCEAFATSGRGIADKERYLTLRFAPIMQPDGTSKWVTTQLLLNTLHSAGPEASLAGLALLATDPAQPSTFQFDQLLTLPENDFFKLKERSLELRGQGTALGCGQVAGFIRAESRPQKGLELSLAGRPLPVEGATVVMSGQGTRRLRLSTQPTSCEGSNAEDLRLEIELQPNEEGKTYIYALGDVLPMQYNTTVTALAAAPERPAPYSAGAPRDEGLAVVAQPAEPGAPVPVDLRGVFGLGDLEVIAWGTVSALDCTAPSP